MSRLFNMFVKIKDFDQTKENKIREAANQEWPSFGNDWFTEEYEMSSGGEGYLAGGEMDDEFADRLAMSIWSANGAYCIVEVDATNLEDIPTENYTPDEEKYKRFFGDKKEN